MSLLHLLMIIFFSGDTPASYIEIATLERRECDPISMVPKVRHRTIVQKMSLAFLPSPTVSKNSDMSPIIQRHRPTYKTSGQNFHG